MPCIHVSVWLQAAHSERMGGFKHEVKIQVLSTINSRDQSYGSAARAKLAARLMLRGICLLMQATSQASP